MLSNIPLLNMMLSLLTVFFFFQICQVSASPSNIGIIYIAVKESAKSLVLHARVLYVPRDLRALDI